MEKATNKLSRFTTKFKQLQEFIRGLKEEFGVNKGCEQQDVTSLVEFAMVKNGFENEVGKNKFVDVSRAK